MVVKPNGTNYIALREQIIQEIRSDWKQTKPQETPQAEQLAQKYFQKYGHQLAARTIRRYVRDVTGKLIYF